MNRKEQTEKFALSAIGYTFAVLGVLILLLTLAGCEKHNDCKTYQCGDAEVNTINYGSYYKYDECECIEKF
jgi:uncharacterized lipoprotein YehR (DUF1307 family)